MLFILLSGFIALAVFIALRFKLNGAIGRILFVLLGLIVLLARSLFMRVPEPEGIYVKRKDVPKLFEIIDDVSNKVNAPKIHKVLINDELNAGIVQRPKLGILGFNTSYLEIGIQLMMALSEEELRAVLAHELGHISNNHGKFGNSIYKVNSTWYRINEIFENRKGLFLIKRFFNWYIPRYNIYSHIILRKQELEADKFSLKVANSKATANSILNIVVKTDYMDKVFWTNMQKKAIDRENPIDNIYEIIMKNLKQELDNDFKVKSIRKIIALVEDPFDTHPPIVQRLEEIGEEIFLPSNLGDSSVNLLEGKLQEYIEIFNKKWKESVEEVWQEEHSKIIEYKETLEEYKKQGGYYKLDEDGKLDFAYLNEAIDNKEEALKWYLEFIKECPDCEDANFFIGRLYIKNDNLEGINYIKKSISLGDTYALQGYKLIYDILVEHDRLEEAKKLYNEASECLDYLDAVYEEKETMYLDDEYVMHDLNDSEIFDIVEQLEKNNNIKEAYLVRKKIKSSKRDEKLYILGIVLDFRWYTDEEKYFKAIEEIVDSVEVDYEVVVICLNLEDPEFKDVFEIVENSNILYNP
ncbi:putative peptidase M48, Ste24p [Clostridium botulinum C str. Eklund]|nr:putative peptidase M48, Ste24p [Clostridium botulinum C str. Eklund]NEZ49891.1 hypothetical protein [Clostridium botulinum]